jgi:hypothetical protein
MGIVKYRKIIISIIGLLLTIIAFSTQLISHSVEQLKTSGIPENSIYIALIIPVIAFFITFSRIIVGISLNNFITSAVIIICSFIIGILPVIVLIILITLIGLILRTLLSDFHCHFVSKIALMLSFLSVILLILLPFIQKYLSNDTNLIIVSIIIFITIIEKYLNFKITKNKIFEDLKNLCVIVISSVIFYFLLGGKLIIGSILIQFTQLKYLITVYPDSIILFIILNLIIGIYTGLRISEMIKFRKLIFK